ncbi:hypothetical protein LRS74_08725 [Streptomyces sp. LX-29]|uniref:hypothetical protein n=1 Tax=Streptomyces sp. LX-29 TaxID=2900152 RepID=UPI00240D591C|nr:hypothetical protein [Streptomyces sp. LX-29]WFB07126.1 hypothetical protein LRS74_08725 [Streptomyces sp. LX-29]
MGLTTHQRDPVGPRRRHLLLVGGAAGAAALLAGCSETPARSDDAPAESPAAIRLRERAHRDSATLLARYDATAKAHPALAERLRPLREETARHVAAFAARPDTASPAPGSPSARAGAGRKPAAAPEVPKDGRAALTELARAERLTADERTRALVDAPGELARLLASVAACGAAHAFLLSKDD